MGDMCFMKTVLINRAVPGSGKTTFAKDVQEKVVAAGYSIRVHSTDEYFMRDGRYVFDVSLLAEYHARNLAAFRKSLRESIDLVVVDNTSIRPWETQPYTDSARTFGYRVVFLNFAPRALRNHVLAQRVTPEKPDAHEVPEESLREHIREFRRYDDLLQPDAVPDPARHPDYRWDDDLHDVVPTGKVCCPFDFDAVIRIYPHTYHRLKHKIGERVVRLLQGL